MCIYRNPRGTIWVDTAHPLVFRAVYSNHISLFFPDNFYRPHPKDGGRYCFQFVSSHLDGAGTPSFLIGPGRGGNPYPRSGLGGGVGGVTPCPCQVEGQDGGVPLAFTQKDFLICFFFLFFLFFKVKKHKVTFNYSVEKCHRKIISLYPKTLI